MQSTSIEKIYNNRDLVRQQIVRLIFIVYWLLIFEGSLRKWALPQLNQIIFFIRDPFILFIYYLVWKKKLWNQKSLLLSIGIFLAYSSAILMFVQIITNGLSFTLGLYGWRNYFLYIPLPFIISEQFNKTDLNRILKQTLLIAIPMAILVVFQSLSPADAVINSGVSADYSFAPLGGGVLRTQGTFTSSLGQTMFIGSIVAMVISIWVLPSSERFLTGGSLYTITLAVVTNLIVSGSRGAFATTFILLFATTAFSVFLGRHSIRALITITFMSSIGTVLTQTLFYNQFNALVNRANGAAKLAEQDAVIGSDMLGRVINSFISFIDVASQVPLIGLGLGLGGNASTQMGSKLSVGFEDDWSRNIVELGPFLGLSFIVFRIAITIWLFSGAFKAAASSHTLLPLLLTTFTATIFLNGLLTGNGTANGYGWLFMGFSMAAINSENIYKKHLK